MEGNNSYRASWAEQWDSSASGKPEPAFAGATTTTKTSVDSSSRTAKYKHMAGEGLLKTKAVAFIGAKKVKVGTSSGLRWIKDKYHKTTQKH